MAKLTQHDKELILADFHTGQFTQRELALSYKVSVAVINKIVKGLKPKHTEKVNTQVSILSALSGESEQEVKAINKAVQEKTKHLQFFQNSALKNQAIANKKLNDSMPIHELESHSRITQRNKDSVLGKQPDTVINNANIQSVVKKRIFVD
jgi:hypothetical protein